ncbi:YceD family protein [Hydrogenophaga sp. BPS33]|uniref:YceD family protein n=1 Tax=Hydrogenophaga sp. BPS33 TaxID=2651974 RepID=UPI00131F5884|nr:DUF177 domain-containing protein [Hydrogenophaga sp. BPS33]QHE85099.1 DUF177 domain-containing protein [Hydrogenophaga sp. BPS33]
MKTNPKAAWNPDRLDVRAFAQAGAQLEAEEALAAFKRLHAETALDDGASGNVQWRAQGEMRPGATEGALAVWLHLEAQTRVPLTCQRCLGVVETPLTVDRWFRFVADEAAAEAEDDDCEEDLLALEPRPNLRDVLEDELLMELPLVPMHEVCPVSVRMQAADPQVDTGDGDAPKNPFAALAQLKKSN